MIALAVALWLAPNDNGLVTIPAGSYQVGKADRLVNYSRRVTLKQFEIAKLDTTNAEFAGFVRATGYVTDAEKNHNAMVFKPGLKEFAWLQDHSASWRFPNGKSRGSIVGKMDHPVTTISFHDATEYCKWA